MTMQQPSFFATYPEFAIAGGVCPYCHRFAKIYGRPLNRTMVRSLAWLAQAEDRAWVDVPNTAPKWLVRTNQLASCRWWGLVERRPNTGPTRDASRKHLGYWRATTLGRQFVQGLADVPKTAWTYDGEVVWMDTTRVVVTDIIKGFDYREVMGG